MAAFQEFAKTLEHKIRQEIESEYIKAQGYGHASVEPEPHYEIREELPLGFAWLLGQENLAQTANQTSKARKAYGVKARPRPDHQLTPQQKEAYMLFEQSKAALARNFTPTDLRTAWRKLAITTHPDQGGTAEAFQKAKSAHECLKQLFK